MTQTLCHLSTLHLFLFLCSHLLPDSEFPVISCQKMEETQVWFIDNTAQYAARQN